MQKKEWLEVLKSGLFFTAAMFMMPVFILLARLAPGCTYSDVFFLVSQFGLFFWAFFMGASFLMSERLQRSEIYLLSLPYTKSRLLFIKVLPRLVGALVFFGLYTSAYLSWGENSTAFSFISFALIYFSLFCISLSFSLSSENFLVLFFLSLFGLMAFLGLLVMVVRIVLYIKDYYLYEPEVFTFFNGELDEIFVRLLPWTAAILLLPLIVSFNRAFKKWDARPVLVHNLRFIKTLVPWGVVSLIAAVFFLNLTLNTGFRIFHLTRGHQLIENHALSGVKIYAGSRAHKIRELGDYVWGFADFEGAAYCQTPRGIGRIDLSDYSQELVYELLPGREIEGGFRYFDGCLAFFTNRRTGKDQKFEVLDVSTRELRSVEWDLDHFARYYRPWLFAADVEDGERFWLFRLGDKERIQHIYRLWEDGRYERVAESRNSTRYLNGTLMTYSDGHITFLKIDARGTRIVRNIPNPDGFDFGSGWNRDLGQNLVPRVEIYGYQRILRQEMRSDYRFARLDLEDFIIVEVDNMKIWDTEFGAGNHFLIEQPDRSSRDLNIYSLSGGEITFMKTLASIDREKTEWNLNTFETGLVIEEGRSVTVFSVPALEELKYKKLD